ncbi:MULTISPECIES: hypothetical protein [Sinorhizobium]|uniref:hypothetical protein n=1 Tax=Sinorhizobium TaxID=28105 RepID=UPI001AECF74D|nr:hypothetical protein [Sinorhizobium sp. M4_45]
MKIADRQFCCLIRASTAVVQEQQQSMMARAQSRTPVGLTEKRIHRGLFEISDRGLCRLLEWYCPYLGTPARWTGERMPMKRANE